MSCSAKTTFTSLSKLPTSPRYFWKDTFEDQIGINIQLDDHQISTLGLNEIAADKQQGFFFHLRCRDYSGTSHATGDKYPNRVLSSQVSPSMLYSEFSWTTKECITFGKTSHSNRLVISDGLINLPPDGTPMYPVQYISESQNMISKRLNGSMVVVQATKTFYVIQLSQLIHLIESTSRKRNRTTDQQGNILSNGSATLCMPFVDLKPGSVLEREMAQYSCDDLLQVYSLIRGSIVSRSLLPLTSNVIRQSLRQFSPLDEEIRIEEVAEAPRPKRRSRRKHT